MKKDRQFKIFKDDSLERKIEYYGQFINKTNILLILLIIGLYALIYFGASWLDSKSITNENVWIDRYWTVGFSGLFIFIAQNIFKGIKAR